jgi:hypothetical protein
MPYLLDWKGGRNKYAHNVGWMLAELCANDLGSMVQCCTILDQSTLIHAYSLTSSTQFFWTFPHSYSWRPVMVQKSVRLGTLKRWAVAFHFAFVLSVRLSETWNLVALVLESGRGNRAGKEGAEVGNPWKRTCNKAIAFVDESLEGSRWEKEVEESRWRWRLENTDGSDWARQARALYGP